MDAATGPTPALPHEVRWAMSFVLLRDGHFEEGWKLYESRPARVKWSQSLSFPEWQGEPVRSLLVLPEQGLGDQIQFVRFVAVLKAQGVAVTLLCPPMLVRLFSSIGVAILPASGDVAIPRHDAWCLIGSLPGRLGVNAENLPTQPYLPSAAGGAGVGLATQGSPHHMNDRNRSLPPPLADRLLALAGVSSLHPEDTGVADLEATARIIDGLKLVISVDTAVAHLAGAMGKPVWILLPHAADWRWLTNRADSPWYPSARLYRQATPGDWAEVLDRVECDLAADAS